MKVTVCVAVKNRNLLTFRYHTASEEGWQAQLSWQPVQTQGSEAVLLRARLCKHFKHFAVKLWGLYSETRCVICGVDSIAYYNEFYLLLMLRIVYSINTRGSFRVQSARGPLLKL